VLLGQRSPLNARMQSSSDRPRPSSRRRLLVAGGATAAGFVAAQPHLATAVADTLDASDTTKGITKLSVAPDSADNPIALGVNDPRVPPGDKVRFMLGPVSDPNPQLLLGWNAMPDYTLVDPTDKGLAWVIETNYDDGSGHNKMEAYVQFLDTDATHLHVRRPFMSQIDKVTGQITATTLTGGSALSLRLHDGSYELPDPDGAVGKEVLGIDSLNRAVFGAYSTGTMSLRVHGQNDAGNAGELRLVDRKTGDSSFLAQRSTALGSGLSVGFRDREHLRVSSGGRVDIYNGDLFVRSGGGSSVGLGALGTGGEPALKLGSDVVLYRTATQAAELLGSLRVRGSHAIVADLRHEGNHVGFFGARPVGRQTVAPAATDAASTKALVNDLRAKLISLGLVR
jgi:hypothetical protein